MKHGRWLTAWTIPVTLIILIFASPIFAQEVQVYFRWESSRLVDDRGQPRAPAVEYKVYHQREGGAEQLIATVDDTTYALMAERGVHHRIRVCGVDVYGRLGDLSDYSDDVFIDIQQSGGQVPSTPSLRQNYPNPFNPETNIVYGVPDNVAPGTPVAIEIYNLNGHRVRLLRPNATPGWHTVSWDGKDDSGRVQPTGQYITRFTCGGRVQTSKMTMVK